VRYPLSSEPSKTMTWSQGQPCSHCGKPTEAILHQFQGGNDRWTYLAPLYHNAERNLGFCDVRCSFEWSSSDYVHIGSYGIAQTNTLQ
jgi:hypothetical protein